MAFASLAASGCSQDLDATSEQVGQTASELRQLETLSEGDLLGETPFWDEQDRRLLWSDIGSAKVYSYSPETGQRQTVLTGYGAYGLIKNRDGALIVMGATGMHYVRNQQDIRPIISSFEGQSLFFNEAVADKQGRIYVGNVIFDGTNFGRGKLFLIDTHGTATVVDNNGIGLSNGLGISPDDRTLYYADSYDHVIYAYDINPQTGLLSQRRVFATLDQDEGIPDGLTVDSKGGVWVAVWYGSEIIHYNSAGSIVDRIHLPVWQPSNVVFGGKQRRDLYITSGAAPFRNTSLAPPGFDFDTPNPGGQLFRISTHVKGRPEYLADMDVPPPSQ